MRVLTKDHWTMTVGRDRLDWSEIRDRVNLAAVATALLGPAPGRRGEKGRRLWWPCPFHEDKNPSFVVERGKPWWRCWGCGEHGDAPELVMRLQGVSFPEAVRWLAEQAGVLAISGKPPTRLTPRATSQPAKAPECPATHSSGLPLARCLESGGGCSETIVGARGSERTCLPPRPRTDPRDDQGRAPRVDARNVHSRPGGDAVLDGRRDGDSLARWRSPGDDQDPPPRGERTEVRRSVSRPAYHLPSPLDRSPWLPLVVCEGELDCVLLAQALGDLAAVVTLGIASARPEGSTYLAMLPAPSWYIATDGDAAGDKAAAGWPARAIRVKPPNGKDWTEAHRAGIDLRRWWIAHLDATEAPDPPEPAPWKVSPSGVVEPWTEPPSGTEAPAVEVLWPPRPAELADWPIAWRERWGRLANDLGGQGTLFPDSEAQAFRQVKAEMESGYNPLIATTKGLP